MGYIKQSEVSHLSPLFPTIDPPADGIVEDDRYAVLLSDGTLVGSSGVSLPGVTWMIGTTLQLVVLVGNDLCAPGFTKMSTHIADGRFRFPGPPVTYTRIDELTCIAVNEMATYIIRVTGSTIHVAWTWAGIDPASIRTDYTWYSFRFGEVYYAAKDHHAIKEVSGYPVNKSVIVHSASVDIDDTIVRVKIPNRYLHLVETVNSLKRRVIVRLSHYPENLTDWSDYMIVLGPYDLIQGKYIIHCHQGTLTSQYMPSKRDKSTKINVLLTSIIGQWRIGQELYLQTPTCLYRYCKQLIPVSTSYYCVNRSINRETALGNRPEMCGTIVLPIGDVITRGLSLAAIIIDKSVPRSTEQFFYMFCYTFADRYLTNRCLECTDMPDPFMMGRVLRKAWTALGCIPVPMPLSFLRALTDHNMIAAEVDNLIKMRGGEPVSSSKTDLLAEGFHSQRLSCNLATMDWIITGDYVPPDVHQFMQAIDFQGLSGTHQEAMKLLIMQGTEYQLARLLVKWRGRPEIRDRYIIRYQETVDQRQLTEEQLETIIVKADRSGIALDQYILLMDEVPDLFHDNCMVIPVGLFDHPELLAEGVWSAQATVSRQQFKGGSKNSLFNSFESLLQDSDND